MKISLKSAKEYFWAFSLIFSMMVPVFFPAAVFLPLLILFVSALHVAGFAFTNIHDYTGIVLFTQKRE